MQLSPNLCVCDIRFTASDVGSIQHLFTHFYPHRAHAFKDFETNFLVLQTEKIELETTVVDETKGRDSCCGQGNRRFSGQFSFHAYILI